MFLPFVDMIFPATADDPRAMGAATVTVLSVLAGVWLLAEIGGFARERARGKAADE